MGLATYVLGKQIACHKIEYLQVSIVEHFLKSTIKVNFLLKNLKRHHKDS